MSAAFNTRDLIAAISRLSQAAQIFVTELNEADAKLGDGDLGITLSNGWRAASEKLDLEGASNLGNAFLKCAQAFQETSASSFGTLTATGLMAAAKLTLNKTEVDLRDIHVLVQAALDDMAKRGKAQLGDKTVLDALNAIAVAARLSDDENQLKHNCVQASAEAVEKFRLQPNKIGRARMFGDDSIGIVDPGMLAVQRMTESV